MLGATGGLAAMMARWATLMEGPALAGTIWDSDAPAGDVGSAPPSTSPPELSPGVLAAPAAGSDSSDPPPGPAAPPVQNAGDLAGRDFTSVFGLAGLRAPDAVPSSAASTDPTATATATLREPDASRSAAFDDGARPDDPSATAERVAVTEDPGGASASPVPVRADPSRSEAGAVSASLPAMELNEAGVTAQRPDAVRPPRPSLGSASADGSRAGQDRTGREDGLRREPGRLASPRLQTRHPLLETATRARMGGGVDLIDTRTAAVLRALLAANADIQPGAGTILPSCILNAAMIPGWPPPRPFDHPAPKDLVKQLARQVDEAASLETLLKGNPESCARWRKRLARLARSRRLRVLLGLEGLLATIDAVIAAIEEELMRLAPQNGRGGGSDHDHDELAEAGLHQRLKA